MLCQLLAELGLASGVLLSLPASPLVSLGDDGCPVLAGVQSLDQIVSSALRALLSLTEDLLLFLPCRWGWAALGSLLLVERLELAQYLPLVLGGSFPVAVRRGLGLVGRLSRRPRFL